MGFSIKGYVLEPPRVGQSNSPFTSSPNNYISDPGAFNTAYPNTETNPRTDYLVMITDEGVGKPGLLVNAFFGWTKNEIVRRFDYSNLDGRFKPLPGGAIVTVGPITPAANTSRLKVPPPLQALPSAPFRLSIGTVGSGITQTVTLVLNDGVFGAPPAGTTELSLATGNLNWNPSDLTAYNGQTARFQQQAFFDFDKSTGNMGLIDDPVVLLNPIPGPGQFPLIRIGYGLYLDPIERPNEGSFLPNPASGTVEWAANTGRLKFNSGDIAAHIGMPVYYDGSLFALGLQLPRQSIGTVSAPTNIVGLPPDGGDLIFALPSAVPYFQFSTVRRTTSFDSGKSGEVQVNPGTGAVQFSVADQGVYGSQPVQVVFGDLVIDHGISIRLFRSPVNLDASQDLKDVTAFYSVTNAIWAKPIIGSPQVFLPSVPIDDPGFPMTVTVAQGTGSFTGTLNRLDVPAPPAGLGYFIDFDKRIFNFAQRKNQALVPILKRTGAQALPDPLVLPGNVVLELETGVGTNVFAPLTIGTDALLDSLPGVVNFTTTQGVPLASGSQASFSGTTFTDGSQDFVTSGVLPGDFIVVASSAAKGVYTVMSVTPTVLTTDVVAQTPSLTGPPASVSVSNAAYTVERGKEVLADRFFQEVTLIDPSTKVERIRSLGSIQNATTIVATQNATFPDFLTLSDGLTNFQLAGVQVGDTVLLNSGPDVGSTRTITFVGTNTVSVASNLPFTSLTPATYSILRRRRIPITAIGFSRFRVGVGSLISTVNPVPTDGSFTNPIILPSGTCEVSETTGNLNFSAADLAAADVFWIYKLKPKTDYQLSPQLGLVQFTDRMLSMEEALITYTPAPPVTDPPTPAGPPVEERATWLIRKEQTADHPTPTSNLSFNPTGRTIASNPTQAVFRGGRPQVLGVQCVVDINPAASTITFLPDDILTDALPHGAIVGPTERVLIDYFVYEAIGGEKTTTVLQSPMLTALVIITDGENSFTVHGDHTASFPPGFLMRIEQEQVYLIGTSVYTVGSDSTTVTLAGSQVFQDSFTDPKIYVSSGPTRLAPSPPYPAYFTPELQAFDPVARGMNKLFVFGDRSASYHTGTVVYFTDGSTYQDFLQVTGAAFKSDTGKTEITFAANALRQYMHGSAVLSYSVRPVFEDQTSNVITSKLPVLTEPYQVFRRKEGEAGLLLLSPTDYEIDDAGNVKFTPPLRTLEELSIFYTGHRIVDAGLRLRASYTFTIAPTTQNGLDGQILQANYWIFAPDSFYYRVETLTNFKGEVAQEIQAAAQAGSPSSGPQTSNSSSPQLFQQGRESVFFQEGHLANQDLVARSCLKFFNDAVNYLEDALHALDGRVVGDNDGRFKFDGNINNPVRMTVGDVTNQIDDRLLVSPFPLPDGTTQKIYLTGPFSRFFKNRRDLFATSPAQVSGAEDGTPVAKATFNNLLSLPSVAYKRKPRAQIQFNYPYGTTTFVVDNANGTNDALQRPSFVNQMRIVIEDPQGRFYVLDSDQFTVTSFTATSITISGGVHSPTPGPDPGFLPAGSTIYISPSDANTSLQQGDYPPAAGSNGAYMMQYRFGHDVDFNLDTGEFLYVERSFPYNGVLSILPPLVRPFTPFFDIFPIEANDILQVYGANLNIKYVAPYKFPALYGGTTNDDGDQSLPILGPTFDGELTTAGGGPLNDEKTAEQVGGTIRNATTAPYVGTGDLDVTATIITDTNPYGAPLPKVHDLVRILTGLNGATEFRRITAVGANTVTVDSPFNFQDTGFSYTISVSSTTVTGTATLAGTTFTDVGALFLTSVQVGWTIVMTSGPNIAERRQIAAIVSNTVITLDSAFPSATGGTYRVDNPLDTYSGPVIAIVSSALATELATIDSGPNSERASLLAFFGVIFTTLVSSVSGSAPTTTQLVDLSVNFVTSGVNTSHFVYITTGTFAGIYQIASVDSPTQITLATPFPTTGVGITYQIVSAFGAGFKTFEDVFSILTANDTFVAQTLAFQTLFNAAIPVLLVGSPDLGAFARGYLTTDLDNRVAEVNARLAYLSDLANGPIAKIQKALTGSDRLYDKRYSWVDARINQETGYLVKELRAVDSRIKAQEDIVNQLIKLLTVQGS